jgi:hypothetical protein
MQFILSVARYYVTIDTVAVTADNEGRRRVRRWSTERYSVYKPCVLVPSCTRRVCSANETFRVLALLVIHRQAKFVFKFAIHFMFGVFWGLSYFKSIVFYKLGLCLKAQHTSYATLELFVIPVLCLWFKGLKYEKSGGFLPLFQQMVEICICHSIHELGMLRLAKTELLFVSKQQCFF